MDEIEQKPTADGDRRQAPPEAEPDPVRAVGLMFAKRLGIKAIEPGQRRGDGFFTVNHVTGTRKRGSEIPRPIEP